MITEAQWRRSDEAVSELKWHESNERKINWPYMYQYISPLSLGFTHLANRKSFQGAKRHGMHILFLLLLLEHLRIIKLAMTQLIH